MPLLTGNSYQVYIGAPHDIIMDKTFIMQLDSNNDLLGKDQPVQGVIPHPIPFTTFTTVPIKRDVTGVEVILRTLKDYHGRTFRLIVDDYGLPVSVTYLGGKFKSMILKGTGVEGERVKDEIALGLVPAEAKSDKDITMHALLTIKTDLNYFRGGIEAHEVPKYLRSALRFGFEPFESKSIVYRVLRLYKDGVLGWDTSYNVWELIGNLVLAGYYLEYDYAGVEKYVQHDFIINAKYALPQRGIIIEDTEPGQEGAFPETHFLFEPDSTIEEAA